jgi:hypothetical protein
MCSYDHMDLPTLQQIHELCGEHVHFLVPLGEFLSILTLTHISR